MTELQLADIITSLRELSDEELKAQGFAVDGTFSEVDDPILIGPDGVPVETWREGYPYTKRMTHDEYDQLKRLLQIELLKAQVWIKETDQRLVVLFEGRDTRLGKGGTIKRFTEHLNPAPAHRWWRWPTPSEARARQWYFQRYVAHLPTKGEIVLFDRSWYNRAVVERVMGFLQRRGVQEFIREVPQFEQMLTRSGIHLVKLWFSVSRPRADHPFRDPPHRSGSAVEAQSDGPGLA